MWTNSSKVWEAWPQWNMLFVAETATVDVLALFTGGPLRAEQSCESSRGACDACESFGVDSVYDVESLSA